LCCFGGAQVGGRGAENVAGRNGKLHAG